jgi:hypothetical protein
MFADDIVLVRGNLKKVNYRLDNWRSKRKGLKINRNKTEYIQYDFGGS